MISPRNSTPARSRGLSVLAAGLLTLSSPAAYPQLLATATFSPSVTSAAALPQAPSAVASSLHTPGGALVPRATDAPIPLSLDLAIDLGLKQNQQLTQLKIQDRLVRGQILTAENALLPNITAVAQSTAEEINLAAMGFKASSLAGLGLPVGTISTIVKVNTTSAQLNVSQPLFDLPSYYLFRAAQKAADASSLTVLNGRGAVTLSVGTAYLQALADAAQITDSAALLRSDEAVLRQAALRHEAGVSPNIDVLRARVQTQAQQQALIQAQNTFAKDIVALNRMMGLPAEQQLTLTDTVPYADLADRPLPDALALAYTRRKDLLVLQAELEAVERERKAVRYERMPTLGVNGFYGLIGETTGLYHGNFVAQGTLKIPIFKEAQFRGEREVADAQLTTLRQQMASLYATIEEQIRASMLDVASSADLVRVARSNVALATEALDDTTQRFQAGVDDSLPVVRAQATLADAQTRLVASTFQNNQAKLQLARNIGLVETQYRSFLGR